MTVPSRLDPSPDTLRLLLEPRDGPCVSLAYPTHRAPADRGDGIVLRHLLERAAAALEERVGRARCDALLAPWRALADDPQRLRAVDCDGFAGFAAEGFTGRVPLDGRVEPAVHVADRFHLLPLVERLGSLERCRAVLVTSREVRVVDGEAAAHGAATLRPVPLPQAAGSLRADGRLVRETIVEAEAREPHRVMHGMGALGDAIHGGFGSRTDGIDADTARFLHDAGGLVAAAGETLRYVIVGLPRVTAAFVAGLAPRGVPIEEVPLDPQRLAAAELAHIVADVLRMVRRRRDAALEEEFPEARAHGRASGDFIEIARAAVAGRVAELFVEEGRGEPGSIDPRTGAVEFPEASAEGVSDGEDLWGALVEIVLRHGGHVMALEAARMPTRTGVAAVYRWGNGSMTHRPGRPGGP
jgi:hypothetical protein